MGERKEREERGGGERGREERNDTRPGGGWRRGRREEGDKEWEKKEKGNKGGVRARPLANTIVMQKVQYNRSICVVLFTYPQDQHRQLWLQISRVPVELASPHHTPAHTMREIADSSLH